jgi:hypothetical protein
MVCVSYKEAHPVATRSMVHDPVTLDVHNTIKDEFPDKEHGPEEDERHQHTDHVVLLITFVLEDSSLLVGFHPLYWVFGIGNIHLFIIYKNSNDIYRKSVF